MIDVVCIATVDGRCWQEEQEEEEQEEKEEEEQEGAQKADWPQACVTCLPNTDSAIKITVPDSCNVCCMAGNLRPRRRRP